MKRWLGLSGWILSLVACGRAAEGPTPRPTAFPSATAAASPTATAQPPTLMPTLLPTPIPSARGPTPASFPDGFRTDPDWFQVFHPALDANPERWKPEQWENGSVWWTNGQHWIGPFPASVEEPYLEEPYWTWRRGKQFVCYEGMTCFLIPDALGFDPAPGVPRERIQLFNEGVVECGPSGERCVVFPDGQRSSPFRLPLPAGFSLQTLGTTTGGRPLDWMACLTPDRRRALFAIQRLGGPGTEMAEDSPLVFPGALYWVNLETGEVRPAPTNAPDLPAQQALAQAMVARGVLPAAFLPLFTPPPAMRAEDSFSVAVDPWDCSPSGRFAFALLLAPIDAGRFGMRGAHQQWVIRLEDGVGYPISVSAYGVSLYSELRTAWIPFKDSRGRLLLYRLPDDSLP